MHNNGLRRKTDMHRFIEILLKYAKQKTISKYNFYVDNRSKGPKRFKDSKSPKDAKIHTDLKEITERSIPRMKIIKATLSTLAKPKTTIPC